MLLNLAAVMLRLWHKNIDHNVCVNFCLMNWGVFSAPTYLYNQIDHINPMYCLSESRLDVSDITKVGNLVRRNLASDSVFSQLSVSDEQLRTWVTENKERCDVIAKSAGKLNS